MRVDGGTPQLPREGARQQSGPLSVRPGDVIDAEVVSARDGQLTLKMSDGTVATARSERPIPAVPGHMLRLSVLSQLGDMLTVEQSRQEPAPRDLLRQLGLKATQQNLGLAEAIVSSDLPAGQQSWDKLQQAATAFPELSPEQAAFMLKHQVPINRQNAVLFNRLSSQEHLLGNQLTKLEALLADAARTTSFDAGEAPVVPGSFGPVFAQKDETGASIAHAVSGISDGSLILTQAEETLVTEAKPLERNVLADRPATTTSMTESVQTSPETDAPSEHHVTISAQPDRKNAWEGSPISGVADGKDDVMASKTVGGASALPPGVTKSPESNKPPNKAGNYTAAVESKSMTNRGVSIETDILGTGKNIENRDVNSVAGNKTIASLKETITDLFYKIRKEQSATQSERLPVAKLTRAMADALKTVAENIESLPAAQRDTALGLVKDITSGIRFSQQLQHFSAVIQMPVDVNGQQATAELYVFKDKAGQKRVDPQNATLFLSLGTAHIGRVETLVRVIGQNVECDFHMEETQWADESRAQAGMLRQLLESSGYRLMRSSFSQEAPAVGPVSINEAKEKFSKRYRFEAKA